MDKLKKYYGKPGYMKFCASPTTSLNFMQDKVEKNWILFPTVVELAQSETTKESYNYFTNYYRMGSVLNH